MTKKELRKIYLNKRTNLSEEEYEQLNQQLCDHFFKAIDLSGIFVLHTFLPIKRTREVNTWLIIDRIKKDFPQLKVAVPKINNQTSELEHYYLESPEQLKNNTWEIPEPVYGIPTPTNKIDIVLVPLLAFDKQGHRLGYGRGFYDKFLAGCRPDCVKIGLSFFEAEEIITGINEKDIPLNLIVTPKTVLKVSNP